MTTEEMAELFEAENPYAARAVDVFAGDRLEIAAQAQVFATLAVAYEQFRTHGAIGDALGDDSHLDGLKVTLRDLRDR